MLYGILVTIFVIISLLLGLLILIQQSKSNAGLGSIGGGAQLIFGGSGGQDIFQKTTWVLGGLFMILSLFLAMAKSRQLGQSSFDFAHTQHMPLADDQY